MDLLRGELLSFTVRGNDFWGVGTLRTQHDGGDVTIVGKVLGAHPGDTLELDGEWSSHPKFGRQFKLRRADVVLPSDTSGVVGWLSAKLPQISRRRAEVLVQAHGVEELWRLLERADVEALCVVDGINAERAEEIITAYRAHRLDRDRIVRLKQWGLTDNQIARVIAEWGDEAERRLEDNPYDLIACVPGFGWQRADQVARRMGVPLDAPARLRAGLMHAMTEAAGGGHVYVPQGKLTALVATKVCGVEEVLVRASLVTLLADEGLVRLDQNVYLPKLARAEERLAQVFAARAQKSKALIGR